MDGLSRELSELLRAVERTPNATNLRLRACILANRLARAKSDPWYADVAESLALEPFPGLTGPAADALREQADEARATRRAMPAVDVGPDDALPIRPAEPSGALA